MEVFPKKRGVMVCKNVFVVEFCSSFMRLLVSCTYLKALDLKLCQAGQVKHTGSLHKALCRVSCSPLQLSNRSPLKSSSYKDLTVHICLNVNCSFAYSSTHSDEFWLFWKRNTVKVIWMCTFVNLGHSHGQSCKLRGVFAPQHLSFSLKNVFSSQLPKSCLNIECFTI